MKTIVLCAGGHAHVVIEALRSRDIVPFGFADADPSAAGNIKNVPFLGNDDVIEAMNAADVQLVNACGNRVAEVGSGLSTRRAIYERFAAKKFKFPPVIHVRGFVASDAKISEGAHIMAGAIVQAGASVGKNVIVNSGAIVEHHCVVGDHSHIAPGAILCGAVTVGEETHIGAGAIILQGRTIGRGVVIGAGEVVRNNVADGQVLAAGGRKSEE